MAIETNLNQSPYFDDFSEDKNFHRILFRPGYAVQARELTQIQSILQNQIERFANEVLVDGTVVTGCGLLTNRVGYAKLRDKDANNRVILSSDFYSSGTTLANCTITGATTGVTAKLVDFETGSEEDAPNYFSLFFHYTNSGSNNTTRAFGDNEVLLIRNSSDSSFRVAANTITSSSTGYGLRATVDAGIVYHKGNFIRSDAQSIIVDKYNESASRKVGFTTTETTIDSNDDSTLLDNSTGSSNYTAPGANRIKLTPTLATRSLTAANTTTFFTVGTIVEGSVYQKFDETVYSDISDYFAQRIYETNGNYAVNPFNVRVREHLKKTNNLGKYSSGESGNNSLMVAEVEPGIGYVSGNRIEIFSSSPQNFRKATDYSSRDGVQVGQSIGNYVYANEVVGPWDYNTLIEVDLRDAAQNGVTGENYGAQSASGTSIGSANVRAIEWESGTMGTDTGRFRIYLFNVQMDTGKSFAEVKGLYINNASGPKSMADIVLETNGTAKLQEPSLNTLVYPLGPVGTKETSSRSFVFAGDKDVAFSAGEVTFALPTLHAGGAEEFNDQGTLSSDDRHNFIVVAKEEVTSDPRTGVISSWTANTITGSGTSFDTEYEVGDVISMTDGANTVTQRILEISSATSIGTAGSMYVQTSVTGGGHNAVYPTGFIWDVSNNRSGTSVVTNDDDVTINIGQANTSDFDATVHYNVSRTSAVPSTKTINKNKYVKINTSTHSAGQYGPWPLGVSDAFKLVAVYKGSTTGATEGDTNVTSHFELDNGQKDGFYDNSFLRQKADSTLNLSSSGLLVKFNYFGRNYGSGIGFFTKDSYATDDVFVSNTSAITTQEIPLFTSPTSGLVYDLRDSVDFRPKKKNSITPSGTIGSAHTNPTSNASFYYHADGSYCPSPDENFSANVVFYLPRTDKIVLTKEGEIDVVEGIPSELPRTPEDKAGSMSLATIDVPPYPSLSPYVAKAYNRNDYACKINLVNNRRYTMKDLRVIDDRVKNLEYYSSLNALESSAKGKQIFSSSGLDRFKNGFFVDNFDGHNFGDTQNVAYKCAIDRNRSLLRPTFTRNDINMDYSTTLSSSNVTKTGNLLTLSYTHTDLLSQPYASKLRNPVQELQFDWNGEVYLNPDADNTPDITTLPDVQVDFSGMYDAIATIANFTGVNWGAWETTSSRTTSSTSRSGWTETTTNTTQSRQIRSGQQLTVSPSNEVIELGNFVENVAVRDYMRSREIQFTGVRMKPNTRVYPYFDDEPVSNYCTPANSTFANTANEGGALTTDSSGNVYGIFRLPNDDNLKFRIGTKRFVLKDVANTSTESSLQTTSAHGDYTSIQLSVSTRGNSVNMVTPQISTQRVTDTRSISNVSRTTRQIEQPSDPISQTFTINSGASDGVFVTKMDLWFGKKSSTYPITVQIRETNAGYPTETIVPYGSSTLQPSAVSANSAGTGGASDATTFTFDSPVFLKNNTNYAFTVKPGGNSDDYALWVAKMGGTDVDTEEFIHKQTAAGIMFTSANDKAYAPIQDEDIKFKLYKAAFSSNPGTVYIDNDKSEFFSYDTIDGTPIIGEQVLGEHLITLSGVTGNSAGDTVTVGTILSNTASGTANAVVRSIVNDYANGTVIVKADPYNSTRWEALDTGSYKVSVVSSDFTSGLATVGTFTANSVTGYTSFRDSGNQKLHINKSSGSWTTGYIRCQKSGASVEVDAIEDPVLNTLVPKVPQILYAGTSTSWSARKTSSSGIVEGQYTSIDLETENTYGETTNKVFSYTNEQNSGSISGAKTLTYKGVLNSDDPNVSPVMDNQRSSAIVLGNIINNTSTDEHKDAGSADVRFMTKKISLDDGQEAEDLKVFLTAYKPRNTGISVYARVHNHEDPQALSDKDFTPLTQITASTKYSDTLNEDDYVEYEYGFSANTDGQGFLVSANSHARLNSSNNNVIAYKSDDGSIYHTYKNYAIKIVLTASGTNIVPKVRDLRAIALQQ